jgi:predicted PurR-regulated permease PerM
MNTAPKYPLYIKVPLLLLGFFIFISLLSIARDLLLPLIYAIIIAVAISPAINYLVKKGMNRILAIALILLLGILFAGGCILLLSSQASRFSEALPRLTDKFQAGVNQSVDWASVNFSISTFKINTWIAEGKAEFLLHSTAAIGSVLSAMGFILAAASLTVVYICMILFYQSHLLDFIHKLFTADKDKKLTEILAEVKTIIQSYLSGLFVEFLIVAGLNSIGLLLLGIDYAIMLGIIGALLNVIPFVGGIIGVGLFVAIALVTKAPIYAVYVIGLHMFIQFMDNHYIVPKIVGAKVKLNALVCLVAVIGGEMLWGLPGMFLSIPLTAILKLILDRVDQLKPWGFLLGSTVDAPSNMKFAFTIKGFIGNFTSKKRSD